MMVRTMPSPHTPSVEDGSADKGLPVVAFGRRFGLCFDADWMVSLLVLSCFACCMVVQVVLGTGAMMTERKQLPLETARR